MCIEDDLGNHIGGELWSDRWDGSKDTETEARIELGDGTLEEGEVGLDLCSGQSARKINR